MSDPDVSQTITLAVHPLTDAEQARLDYVLSIEHVDNGWLLRQGPRAEVVEEPEGGRDDAEEQAVRLLLYSVMDMLGIYGSKHNPYRVRVVVIDQATGREVEPG